MKSAQVREAFLNYFASQGHTRVASSSLVPADDPTLLFTNAGMNQFKDCFLGLEKRSYHRAVSSQKCVRAGGKHNDLDNVGYTARHHTFFEMLGNFSFGDYFKRDAIHFAWNFLTGQAWLALPPEKLWVTVYATDDEAYRIWEQEIGIPAARIVRIGDNKGAPYASDNFWAMGDTGPCGPCTEIFYDHGPEVAGGPPGSPDEDGDRYIEIWNNVFMQFNRTADGVLHPLPAPSVDTGMGLERITAVLQGVHSNYDTDLFLHLRAATAAQLGIMDEGQASLRVIADHIRSCAFLVADGILPSNEGRGYVLRRIIRRACRHGNKLGARQPFFHALVPALVEIMGGAYPELQNRQADIIRALQAEEEQFAHTLENGLKVMEQSIAGLSGTLIPGSVVFTLADTYGFPPDLTADVARERGLTLDMEGFEVALQEQRLRSRAHANFSVDYNSLIRQEGETSFTGYDHDEDSVRVVAIYRQGEVVDVLQAGDEALVLLDITPFYARSGGQNGDCGVLEATGVHFEVSDTTKQGQLHIHHGRLTEGRLCVGDALQARIDHALRRRLRVHHSATHLLHAALRQLLGPHITQQGSLVAGDYLRFDISHPQPLTPEELVAVARRVNQEIIANTEVCTELMTPGEAKAHGAMALFGEKYGDEVRVLSMGENGFSKELCGGTHVRRTGDIGYFRITSESGVAAGVRRIEAVCGLLAVDAAQAAEDQLNSLSRELKVPRHRIDERMKQLLERTRDLEKNLERAQQSLSRAATLDLVQQAKSLGEVKLLVVNLPDSNAKTLRETYDHLKDRLGSAVVVLATVHEQQISLLVGVSKDLHGLLRAGDLVSELATKLGGKGGGRPDMAQGGGQDIQALPEVLASVEAYCKARLNK